MKFDYCIGNPPYQEDTNGRIADESIYSDFMDAAYEIAEKVELITPAKFLFNIGETSSAWNKKMLNDNHFKVLEYYHNAKDVFSNVGFMGGVAIHYRDSENDFGKIEFFTPIEELKNLKNQIREKDEDSLNTIMYLQNKFDLEKLYEDYPNVKKKIGGNGTEKRLVSNCFKIPNVFSEEKLNDNYVKIHGIINNNQRLDKWIDEKYLLQSENFEKYKVIVPNSNGSEPVGKGDATAVIGDIFVEGPKVGYTQSFIAVGAFETIEEAQNAEKYLKTKFCRAALGIKKRTQSNTLDKWVFVPIQDFNNDSEIDWSKSIHEIDLQLYRKYKLEDAEIEFIETKVKEMK